MSEIILNAVIRNPEKKASRKLRIEGKVPGVFYFHGENNLNISATELGLKPLIYSSETHIVNLVLENGETKKCILKDFQLNPITDKVMHFDLVGISDNEIIDIEVPIVLIGTPKGIKDGGTLQHTLHKLKVSCLPKFIPEHIEINIAELGINTSVHVSDLKIENVTILELSTKVIVAVVPPTVLKELTPAEAEAAAAAATAEPELIAKGKKPEEEEEIKK